MSDYQKKVDAVQAIIAKEKTQSEVARTFGISRQAVSIWIKRYKETGELVKQVGRGRAIQGMTHEQREKVLQMVKGHLPSDYGIETEDGRWCVDAANILLHQECGRTFSLKFCMNLLEQVTEEHLSLQEELLRQADNYGKNRKKWATVKADSHEEPHVLTVEELKKYEDKVAKTKEEMAAKGIPAFTPEKSRKRGSAFTKPKKKKKKANRRKK